MIVWHAMDHHVQLPNGKIMTGVHRRRSGFASRLTIVDVAKRDSHDYAQLVHLEKEKYQLRGDNNELSRYNPVIRRA